ncbi:MAG: RNase adapter RapZ [Oscillospiraceae bacterium]
MELVIVTGMSGAGKSNAAHALEDIGFYCIDNIPPTLIMPFAELSLRTQNQLSKVAIVTDIRGGEMFDEIVSVLDQLTSGGVHYKVLFLDASDDCLVTRYKETRRMHPFKVNNADITVKEAVVKERMVLNDVRARADYIVDTSHTTLGSLKQRLTSLFLGDVNMGLNIQVISFGFKYGSVSEADLVFDVRCLPNPYYVDELRNLTGLDDAIRDFVMNLEQTKGFVPKLLELLDYSVPLYCAEGKSQLVIAIGCTGGKHRSVVFTELVYNHLLQRGFKCSVHHRDIRKN